MVGRYLVDNSPTMPKYWFETKVLLTEVSGSFVFIGVYKLELFS